MAKPTTSDAEGLIEKYDLSGVIIFTFDDDSATYFSSCGTDPQRCADMESLTNEFLKKIGDAEVTVWSEGDGE